MDKTLKNSLSHRSRSLALLMAHFKENAVEIEAEIAAAAAASCD